MEHTQIQALKRRHKLTSLTRNTVITKRRSNISEVKFNRSSPMDNKLFYNSSCVPSPTNIEQSDEFELCKNSKSITVMDIVYLISMNIFIYWETKIKKSMSASEIWFSLE